MLKIEVYCDPASDEDVQGIKEELADYAAQYGDVKHIDVTAVSGRQLGFGDTERGGVAECAGVKMLYRNGTRDYIVRCGSEERVLTNAYVAAMHFGFCVIETLFARIRQKTQPHPHNEESAPFYDRFETMVEVFNREDFA